MGKNKKIDSVQKVCSECYGYAESFSRCCEAEVENNKCIECGKFCKKHPCMECGGVGSYYIECGDEVQIYMYKNSPEYLKGQFNNGRFKNGRFYRGVVDKIIDKNTISVKFSNRKVNIQIEDIEIE